MITLNFCSKNAAGTWVTGKQANLNFHSVGLTSKMDFFTCGDLLSKKRSKHGPNDRRNLHCTEPKYWGEWVYLLKISKNPVIAIVFLLQPCGASISQIILCQREHSPRDFLLTFHFIKLGGCKKVTKIVHHNTISSSLTFVFRLLD